LIGLGAAAGLMSAGLSGAGSLAYGLGVTMVGWVFAAVAAVTTQLVEAARTANGIALAVFGAAFLLRGIADSASVANDGTASVRQLAWLSPTGWFYQLRAYAGERWWVLGLAVVTGAALTSVAVALSRRRDIGEGLLSARLGPPDARPGLATPLALAWRLQRGGLITWAAGVAVGGALLGSLAHDITDMVGDNATAGKAIRQLGGADVLVDSYLVWVLRILGLAAAAYAVSAVLQLRFEEAGLRAEPVLAAAVTRTRYALSHVLVALAGVVVLLLTAGLVVGLVHGARSGDVGGEMSRILGAALVQLPAVLLPAALAAALFGLLPGATLVAWLFVGVILLIAQLGPVLALDGWVMDVSPFTHLPRLPGGEVTAAPLVALGALVLLLAAAGITAFRRRDLGVT
ncbi:ABC transporter permease, partial [Micromonospora sp. NPDC003776]